MRRKSHLVDAHQHPVDQSHNHHLLEVLHRRVLVDLLHDEVRDEPGDVPSKKSGFVFTEQRPNPFKALT